jgi:cytochrome b pre-mRNA-processing protein 3
MPLAEIFRRNAAVPVRMLYGRIVAQARLPVFYERWEVPDSLDGRFELVALHCFLVLRRLRKDGQATGAFRQQLFDWMFADMDAGLRELGVGDLGVGRRVKDMARAFYGRIAAYDRGLDRGGAVLTDALRRNLYGTVDPAHGALAAMAAYVQRVEAGLTGQRTADLLKGTVEFDPAAISGPGRAG